VRCFFPRYGGLASGLQMLRCKGRMRVRMCMRMRGEGCMLRMLTVRLLRDLRDVFDFCFFTKSIFSSFV